MPVYIYTPRQVLRIGLKVLGVDDHRQQRQSKKSNLEDFKCHYGTYPIVVAEVWEELQTTSVDEARIHASAPDNRNSGANFKNFLRSLHFLMRYGTEGERKVASGNSKKTVRKWTWFFLEKIQALRKKKIVLPDTWTANFIISLDGVHCCFHEEKHPTLSKNPKLYSHKFNGPGLAYELALDLWESKLVWLKGPLKAGNADLGIYQGELKGKIPANKKIVTDGGYSDLKDPRLAQPNSHDTPELRTFKARGRMRQEAFHTRIKRFNCLTNQFRHGMDRHGTCFTSVCVLLAYEMELVTPMWDV